MGWRFPLLTLSAGGRGLLRISLTFVVDDVGVPCAELEGDWLAPEVAVEAWDGEDVPPVAGSFFLDALFESFARESCSC